MSSERNSRWMNLILVALSLVVALALAEWALRAFAVPSAPAESMTPGLIQYDPRLGWTLARSWQGRHEHEEFSVSYQTDGNGFRTVESAARGPSWQKRTLWLGDSFTFGLGVNDAETFVERLNVGDKNGSHLNAAVPGFSTDQQLLRFERILRTASFDRVILVTYLANDLVDNRLDYPIQAEQRKPRFQEVGGVLQSPSGAVKTETKPASAPRDLAQVLLNHEERARLAGHGSALLARLVRVLGGEGLSDADLDTRLTPYLDFYRGLLDRFYRRCEEKLLECRVIAFPGRSYYQAESGLSARIQARLIAGLGKDERVRILTFSGATEDLFYPRDGHFTPAGHQAMAALLAAFLSP